jgi:uncharacterized protein YhdP
MTATTPASGPVGSDAGARAVSRCPAWLHLASLVLGPVVVLLAAVLVAFELAAARAPQHRAALEELIRHETGLEITFSELSLEWGWHGPEAVFQAVALGEPAGGALLRAPRLIVALDLLRMARSGRPEAGRITLEGADIDLTGGGGAGLLATADAAAPGATGARILSHWRGGAIEIERGTVRGLLPGAPAATLMVRYALLRRLGADWNADARVFLPESLGTSAHIALQMRGDPEIPQSLSGTLSLEGRRLDLGGWRALAFDASARRYLPQAGTGTVAAHLSFAGGHLLTAGGVIHAERLEWSAASGATAPLVLERLRGAWQVTRHDGVWHLAVSQVDTATRAAASPPATLSVDVATDGAWARGYAQHAPLAVLALLARGPWSPMFPGQLTLAGEAHDVRFDWNARRPAGSRLFAQALLSAVSVGTSTGDVLLSGVGGRLSGTESHVLSSLESQAAQLTVLGGQGDGQGDGQGAQVLDHLKVAARLALDVSAGGAWQLSAQELELRGAGASLTASGSIGAAAPGVTPRVSAHLALNGGDVALLARLLAGRADRDGIDWLRAHPQLTSWATAAAALDLRGNTVIDLDLTVPVAAHGAGPGGADLSSSRMHVAATLDGAQLRVVPGLPPIEALHGSLAVAGGRLQRSTFSGRWLGGPVTLAASERHGEGLAALTISGRGQIGAREALRAAGGDAGETRLAGGADWSARLALFPQSRGAGTRWQLHADSPLIGVTSRLPEPFAKSSLTPLPLHIEVQGAAETGQLRVSLGDRLRAAAALVRSGDRWRIERGAVRLAASSPALPAEPVMLLDGRMSRLDLAACLGLWLAAARDAALPELHAHLSAAQLLAGARSYTDVDVAAHLAGGGGVMQLQSAELLASVQWPSLIEREHPAAVHLASFNIEEPDDVRLAAALAAVLSPAAELSIDELKWQGHSLGRLAVRLAGDSDALEVSELHLAGAVGDVRVGAHCAASLCQAHFTLASEDAAGTLSAFGLRPEVSAADARFAGEVQWAPQAPVPLATLFGHLHIDLSAGLLHAGVGAAAGVAPGMPFALLSVPALLAGAAPTGVGGAPPALGFARLTGDFTVRDGQAITSGLHFDGDAEILVRGRVGLAAGDYDEQAWILSGEERLPAPLRHLGPTPRVAALWLSLRDWLNGAGADRSHAGLRLQGSWNDPVVTPAETREEP